MDQAELMRLHVAALFAQDADGRLVTVNEPNGKPAPRLFVGRTDRENAWWVRRDLDRALVGELETACRAVPVHHDLVSDPALAERLSAILAAFAPVERVWIGPAFVCPVGLPNEESAVRVDRTNAELLGPHFEDWRIDAEKGVPMAVSLQDGRAVSVCCSVRLSDQAHEAGVETHPDFRGRGHGARAVAAWANGVRERRRVPLYSTSWENGASRRLAARLGLMHFGTDLHLT